MRIRLISTENSTVLFKWHIRKRVLLGHLLTINHMKLKFRFKYDNLSMIGALNQASISLKPGLNRSSRSMPLMSTKIKLFEQPKQARTSRVSPLTFTSL